MRYKLVIFDFDGTLADSFAWFVRTANSLAERYRFRPVEDGELDVIRALGAREVVRRLGISWWKLPLIARRMRQLKARDGHEIPLFPGVDAMLRTLAGAGVELAIVTSNARTNVCRVLGPENERLIRYWECSASLFGKAPRFRRVLRASGVRPEEALCIGDEIRDAEAARAAGVDFGAVSWGYTPPASLAAHEPAALFTSVDEIVDVVTARK